MSAALQGAGAAWQAGFLALLPAVRTHARIQFRRIPTSEREEKVQEAVASACVSYAALASADRVHAARPGTLADFAVRHARAGRQVGGHQNTRDVMSPAAQTRHGIRVVSCDPLERPHRRGGWEGAAVVDRKAKVSIPDLAAFRIDFRNWLAGLAVRDQGIITALISGEGTLEVAEKFGVTPGRISQLRRRYEQGWQAFQGEVAAGAGEPPAQPVGDGAGRCLPTAVGTGTSA